MPVLNKNNLQIDFIDEGKGVPVIVIHSSISGNRQWRSLIELLKDRYRILAVNLFGYGKTSRWHDDSSQTLEDQASLVLALGEVTGYPVHLVGHSFGASVALAATNLLKDKATGVVLLEPNPFFLLAQEGRQEAFQEVKALRDYVKKYGASGEWARVGERFADYWMGEGAWMAMPPKRKEAFVKALPNNFHEWDAVMNGTMPLDSWKGLTAKTLVVSAVDTRRPIRKIVALFAETYPHWTIKEIPSGGHLAPLTHPDLVNPIVAAFLDGIEIAHRMKDSI